LPERVKADGNEEVCHPQCATKATEPYEMAEVARSAGEVFKSRLCCEKGSLV
jgi:hypothetical protein